MSTAATPLSDLTDVEILELTQKIKSDEAEKSPLVAATEPLSILLEEYAGAETYCGKIKNLQRDWRFVRRVRGDGDCKLTESLRLDLVIGLTGVPQS